MGELARFCAQCGAVAPGTAGTNAAAFPLTPEVVMGPAPQLTRSLRNRKISGVCGGIARHFGVDATIVRILFVVMFFCPVLPAVIPYIVCWIVMPLEQPEPVHMSSYAMAPNQPMTSMSR